MEQQYTQIDYEKSVQQLVRAKHDIETSSLELAYQCRLASKRIKRCKVSKRLASEASTMASRRRELERSSSLAKKLEVND